MNESQMLRYARQLLLNDFGFEAQEKLLDAKTLIIGLGGLGSPVSLYLASSGVGHLTLLDFDQVELSNLSRQIIHRESSLGMDKVGSAKQALYAINSTISVETIAQCLNETALEKLVSEHDVVVDCTDNFEARFAINDACKSTKTPLVSAAVIRAEGQLMVFDFREKNSPCYESLYPTRGSTSSDTCAETGVLSPVVGVLGTLQATEVIKLLAGYGESLSGYLLLVDAKNCLYKKIKISET